MKISALDAVTMWRRWYLSWFARHGLRTSLLAGAAWTVLMYVSLVDGPRPLVVVCWAGASLSFSIALAVHDDPADPDDPYQDYF